MLASLLVIPILLARLNAQEYGQYALFLSISTFLSIIVSGNLYQAITTYFLEWVDKDELERSIAIIFGSIVILSFTVSTVVVIVFKIISVFTDIESYFSIVLSILILACFTALHEFTLTYIRMIEKGKIYLLLAILYVSVDATFKYLYISSVEIISLSEMVLINVASLSIYFIYMLVWCFRSGVSINDFSETNLFIRKISDYTSPLMLSATLTRSISVVDKLVVGWFVGTTELGFYALASRVYGVVSGFRTNMKTIWVPYAVKNYESKEKVNRSSLLFMVIGLILSFSSYLLSYPFVKYYVADNQFIEAVPLVGIFVLVNATMISYITSAVIVPVTRKSKPVAKIQVLSSVLSLLFLPMFCFFFGVSGVIWSMVLQNIALVVFVRNSYREYHLVKFNYAIIIFCAATVLGSNYYIDLVHVWF